jgi:hypothetical protein
MALPGNITTITVTGSYASVTATAAAGAVLFTPSSVLTDSNGMVILTGTPVTAPLVDGTFSIVLPCTDNVSIRPNPFYYTVNEAVAGSGQQPFNIALPSTLGPAVDMSALVPVPSMAQPSPGLYVISVNNQSGSVVLPAGTAVLSGGSATVAQQVVTSSSLIYLTVQIPGGTVGSPYISAVTPGTGFTIASTSGADTSTVAWLVIPAAFD